jgi:hypothetical protein
MSKSEGPRHRTVALARPLYRPLSSQAPSRTCGEGVEELGHAVALDQDVSRQLGIQAVIARQPPGQHLAERPQRAQRRTDLPAGEGGDVGQASTDPGV